MTKTKPKPLSGADLLAGIQPPATPRKRGGESKIIAELRASKEKKQQPVKTVLDWSRK